jgi:hypothetical protein
MCWLSRQLHIPRSSRRRLPEAPARTRESPQRRGSESPAHAWQSPRIPAHPASAMTGLSRRRSRVRVPSLTLKHLQIGIFCRPRRHKRPPTLWIPRRSRTRLRVLQRLFVLMRRRSSLPSRADPARPFAGGREEPDRREGQQVPPLSVVVAARCQSFRSSMARCEPAGAWREAGGGRRSRLRAARDRTSQRRRSRKLPTRSPESSSWVAM